MKERPLPIVGEIEYSVNTVFPLKSIGIITKPLYTFCSEKPEVTYVGGPITIHHTITPTIPPRTKVSISLIDEIVYVIKGDGSNGTPIMAPLE